MKLLPFFALEMRARLAAVRAWNLYGAQGGYAASMSRRPVSRLAAAARALAEQRSSLAEVYAALGAVFPLGLTWEKPVNAGGVA